MGSRKADTEDTGSDAGASSEDSEDEQVAELPTQQQIATQSKKPRISVSAEAFGSWNKKEDFKPPFYEKSEAVLNDLSARLRQAFMFSSLNPEEFKIILGAIQKVNKPAGDKIITQGQDGDNLYVVESGVLTCTRVNVRSCSDYI